MKVYIIIAGTGEYSTYSEEPLYAYFSENQAETHVLELNDKRSDYGPWYSVKSCTLIVPIESEG